MFLVLLTLTIFSFLDYLKHKRSGDLLCLMAYHGIFINHFLTVNISIKFTSANLKPIFLEENSA